MNIKAIQSSLQNLGGRRDAVKVKDLDGMHFIVPQIFPGRTNNEAFIQETIDLTAAMQLVQEKNREETAFPYTFFHIIVAALLKTIVLRPKMNRFIKNKRVYQRKKLTASFVVKRKFADDGAEGMAFITANEASTLSSVHESIRREVMETRNGAGDQSSNMMDIFVKMPNGLSRALVNIIRLLDRMGWAPDFLIETDCYQSSVILSNLGSIQLKSAYHHLANWGTNSVFVTVGERKIRPFFDKDGSVSMKDSVAVGLTIDERLADGYYYAKTIRLFKYLMEHPWLLEKPLGEKVTAAGRKKATAQ